MENRERNVRSGAQNFNRNHVIVALELTPCPIIVVFHFSEQWHFDKFNIMAISLLFKL